MTSGLARIRSNLPHLATSETRVANWVLQNPERVLHHSMAQIAQEIGVSDTTVLRFCRSVGFHGFMDLKISLAKETAQPNSLIHGEVTPDDDLHDIVRKVFQANIAAIQDTLAVMNYEALAQAVELLSSAERILIVGVGTSAPIVMDMFNKLMRLGLNCRAQTDSYLQLMDAALLSKRDVLVTVSQSGSSSDSVLTMEQASACGAMTICITGNAQSPITQYANVVLVSVSSETRPETLSSRIAQITIIDALYIILSMRDIDNTLQNEHRIWDAILPKTC